MQFLPSFPFEITPLIAFGMLLLVGAAGGYIAHRFSWLPSITGFMAVGFLIGPTGLGLLSQDTINNSRILIDIALALILYRLGLSIDIRDIRRTPGLLLVSVIESSVTFGAVVYVLHFFGLPLVVSAVIAAISISSSPAVLLHVAHEVGAKGRVTDSAETLVALNNCISFLAFTTVLPFLHQSGGSITWTEIIVQPTYRFLGSVLVGFLLGMALHQLAMRMSSASQYGLAIVVGSIMIAVGIADFLKLSLLIVPLIMGVTVSSVELEKHVSSIEFGSAFELFFIVLFVYAGANLHLHEIIEYAFFVFLLFAIRSIAKVLSVTSTSSLQGMAVRDGFSSGALLIPMAGLAIGLTQTTTNLFPQYATEVSAIILGSVVLFETVGPPIAKFAFNFCGESEQMRNTKTTDKQSTTQANTSH